MNDQPTQIVVESADPPPGPVGPDEAYLMILADLGGAREDDAAPDWAAHEVSSSTYGKKLETAFRPRFRGAVPDHLTGTPGGTLAVDVTFAGTTPNWPAELRDKVPELAALRGLIRQVETLKRHLSREVGVRTKLEALLAAAVHRPAE